MDDLTAFRDGANEGSATAAVGEELELLILEQGELAFAVHAHAVDSVIPWQNPAILPKACRFVHGVIQDRGRLVAVRRPEREGAQARRIALCTTSKGLIGIPATSTRSVGTVLMRGTVKVGTPVDTDRGVLTILDVEVLAREMTQE